MASSSFNNADGAQYDVYTPSDYITELTAFRRGNIVSIKINGVKNLTKDNMVTVYTLPEKYRPYLEVRQVIMTGEPTPRAIFCSIGTSGAIRLSLYATTAITASNLTATLTFPALN